MIAFAATVVALPQSDIPVRPVGASGDTVKAAVMPNIGTPTTMDAAGPSIVPVNTSETTKTGPVSGTMSILPFTGAKKNSTGTPTVRAPGKFPKLQMQKNGTEAGFCIDLMGMPTMFGGMGGKPPGGGRFEKKLDTRDRHGDDKDDDDKEKKGKWGGMDKKKKHGFGRRMRSVRCERFSEARCAGTIVKKGNKDLKAKSIKCTRKRFGGYKGKGRFGSRLGKAKNGTAAAGNWAKGKWNKAKNSTTTSLTKAKDSTTTALTKAKDTVATAATAATAAITARDVDEDDSNDYDFETIEDDLEDEEIEELEGRSIPLF